MGKALGGDADRGPEAAASDRRAAALAAATLAWDVGRVSIPKIPFISIIIKVI